MWGKHFFVLAQAQSLAAAVPAQPARPADRAREAAQQSEATLLGSAPPRCGGWETPGKELWNHLLASEMCFP